MLVEPAGLSKASPRDFFSRSVRVVVFFLQTFQNQIGLTASIRNLANSYIQCGQRYPRHCEWT